MCYKLGEASRNEKEKGSFSPEGKHLGNGKMGKNETKLVSMGEFVVSAFPRPLPSEGGRLPSIYFCG